MASQYDEIGPGYSDIKKLVTSMVEEVNVRQAVQPYPAKMAHPRRILDLACGTGYYSKKAIDWGADELAKMFRTISANLKLGGGGVFVGLVVEKE